MSYNALLYHIVIRTKRSQKAISETYEKELYAYLLGFMKNKKVHLYRIGGMPDHIHLLLSIPPTLVISEFVRDMKRAANLFLTSNKKKFPYFEGWSESFAVFSYSFAEKETVKQYIMHQKDHHKRISLEDELRNIFEEVGIEYNEECFLKD